jgi:ubiquinone/menaquinone biosynthesis C-methylase UbiE
VADKPFDYDAYQSSFHKAFEPELYGIIDQLPIPKRGSVIDVPCGNGFYTKRLVEKLGAGARLIGIDTDARYLRLARSAIKGANAKAEIQKANAYDLPFQNKSFDLVWCAQSLISLEPAKAVGEMFRITKPDGLTAILEVDEYHHVLLPWPTELEAVLPKAVHTGSVQRYGDGKKLAPTRRLRGILQDAKFESIRRMTHAFDRAAPFDKLTTKFLSHHVHYLKSFAYPHLPKALQTVFDRTTDTDSADSLFQRPDAELVCINTVYYARPAAI